MPTLIRTRRASVIIGALVLAAAGASRSTQIGQLYALSGLTLTIGAELFCNGVPLSDVNDVKPSWTVVTNAQMYQRAGAQFDSALTTLSSSASDLPLRYLARVGKARALVDLGQYAQAAAVVRANGDGVGSPAVPTSFVYNAEYAQGTLTNDIYDWMVATANFAPANKEGGNGLDFFSAQDPRVVMGTATRTGQDGVTPVHSGLGHPDQVARVARTALTRTSRRRSPRTTIRAGTAARTETREPDATRSLHRVVAVPSPPRTDDDGSGGCDAFRAAIPRQPLGSTAGRLCEGGSHSHFRSAPGRRSRLPGMAQRQHALLLRSDWRRRGPRHA